MIKKCAMIIGSFVLSMQLIAQQKFTVKGKLSDLTSEMKVFFTHHDGEKHVIDSVVTKKGTFSFKGTIPTPWTASLELKPVKEEGGIETLENLMQRDILLFFLDPGVTTVTGKTEMKLATVKGGKANADYARLQQILKPYELEMKPLSGAFSKAFTEKNEEEQKKYAPMLRAVRKKMTAAEEEYIKSNRDSYVSLSLLDRRSVVIDPAVFEPLYTSLGNEMKNTAKGKEMGEKLEVTKKTAVGKEAIIFTQDNTEGKPVSLSAFRGKYVLIDFWASWCGPCRAENPNVVKAYNKFKEKNFEIIAVSLDDKKDLWLEAIQKDGLPWINVSDLKGWKNDVAAQYGVMAVPQNFLVDPNGVIIAKNMRGEELEKRLGELIK